MTESTTIYKEGGKWHASNLRLLLDSLQDGSYQVTIKDGSGKRSNPQNDRMHLLFRLYAKMLNEMQAVGGHFIKRWDMESFKEWSLSLYAPEVQDVDPNGEVYVRRKRSHEFTMMESSQFMEELEADMQLKFGFVLPGDGEQTKLKLVA